jgi:hypothetical protein
MVQVMHLYVDDSGTRNLNHSPVQLPAHGHDWFALGGILIKQENEFEARQAHAEFFEKWNLDPDTDFLHSADIRNRTGCFTFLSGLDSFDKNRFMLDLNEMLMGPAYTGFACVIDRPGYEARYREKYGREQWSLCKTAFAVVVERAAKLAIQQGYKLKVFVERSDRVVDGWMKGYYDHMRDHGMPFDAGNSEKYGPLSQAQLHDVLYEFRKKGKSSPLMQVADLYLWPMAIGGYDPNNRAYQALLERKRIIDCELTNEELAHLGVKYSCWELAKAAAEKEKART